MLGYYADLVLMMERAIGKTTATNLNDLGDMGFLSTDAKLWIVKCRRTGVMKGFINMFLNTDGQYEEYQ